MLLDFFDGCEIDFWTESERERKRVCVLVYRRAKEREGNSIARGGKREKQKGKDFNTKVLILMVFHQEKQNRTLRAFSYCRRAAKTHAESAFLRPMMVLKCEYLASRGNVSPSHLRKI